MRTDPRMLLRGLAKFLAVVVAAGLAGALIGIGLAELSGDDAADTPALPATTEQTSTARGQTTGRTTPARTTSTATVYRVPRVQIVSAELGPVSESTGRAFVTIRARLTNRGNRDLTIKTPALLSGDDKVPLGARARKAAGALLKAIAPGKRATGVLRFAAAGAVAQRLAATPAVRLRLGNRTVVVKLTTQEPAG